jgi:hypothetical protein
MASDVHIQVKGLNTFARECRRIGKEAQAELRKTNLKAAELVVPEAIRRAPKGKHEGGPKGRPILPISASIRAFGGQRYAAIRAGSARAPHAPVYEFGGSIPRRGTHATHGEQIAKARAQHRRYGQFGIPHTRINARPYVFPAVEAMQTLVREQYMRDFVKLVSQAFPF